MNKIKLRNMLEAFYLEDIGVQDVTSDSIFPPEENGKGVFIAKEDGLIAGLEIIETAYHLLDSTIEVSLVIEEGDHIKAGEAIAIVSGPVRQILTGERVILNLLQHLSGIATLTNTYIKTLNDSSIQLTDTRKTTPGLRMLEKYAVRVGGGKNHRNGLYDGVMIKDNHISYSGSITKAVRRVKESLGHMVKIEVETETKEQVTEAIEAGADVIMFDNRSPQEVREFASLVPERIITEASGGIHLGTIHSYQGTGVNYISVGALTHSSKSLDISLQVSDEARN